MDECKVRKIGLDPGFGGVKAAEVRGGQIETCVVPSVVGVGSTDSGALNLTGVMRSRRRSGRPFVVAFEGVEYLVGPGVAQYARPIERMDFARFTEGPELRALLYAALYQLLDGGSHQVALAVGLPVEIVQDKDLAAAVERDIAKWLVGTHYFSLDDTEARFTVTTLRAKIGQPVATWFDWGFDLDGRWARGKEAMLAPVLIIDQGFNTLDLLAVQGGQISTRYTGGDTLGMRRAAEMTAGNIQRRYGVELSLHEADALVQKVAAGKRVSAYVMGKSTDVTAEVRQAVNSLGSDVIRFVESRVGKGKKFRILLTGGGAVTLSRRLLGQFPHAEVMPGPALANARGLAKMTMRPGFL
jgi:hypothetical protein